ncbi:hypothetical protein Zm00014a_027350 [Zea mays]|uniref:Uncharacterized protein n=1 Tax=Zea mays TaxID=4577 RepID=A0A3L6FUW3_MAIZE|nr:hypothetical protein Zm00014a_027350 [Zea mays]
MNSVMHKFTISREEKTHVGSAFETTFELSFM